jgi:DNA-binding NarL/FixJ family response regulator
MILDLNLPDGSGLELLPVLHRTTRKPIPVIIFSAQEVSEKAARQVTASLLKSTTSNEDLVSTIRSLVANPLFKEQSLESSN